MKPKDLKPQFCFKDRRPHLENKVLYVPEYYFEHEKFDMPDMKDIFENENETALEYCSGNGDWIIEKAKTNPDVNWIACEIQFQRVRKIWSKRENLGISNLLIVCGEAHTFSKYYLNDSQLKEIYINFPDPWPKDKHAKHRLFHVDFLNEVSRIVKKGGLATFVTDDDTYSESMIEVATLTKKWESIHKKPYYITDVENYGYSYFQNLWTSLGKVIRHMHFKNQKEAPL